MKKTIFIIGIGAVLLSGCNNSDGPSGSQSVDWYMAHPKERAQQIAWCKEQSGAVQLNSQACGQAGKAASKAMAGNLSNMPRLPRIAKTPDDGGQK